MRSVVLSVLAAGISLVSFSTAEAQIDFGSQRGPGRFQVGGDFVVAQPKGELANNIPNGYGLNLTGMFRLDPQGFVSIRGDVGGAQYGRESFRVDYFGVTGRVLLEVETTNSIAWGAIGGHLQIPDGWIRPYANASIAYSHFSTTSSISGTNDSEDYASTTNQSDGTRAWIFGGGLVIPFGNRYSLGGLNLGARYYYGGEAEYLREGDITDNIDGSITTNPQRSKTDMVVWQVGVSFVLPRSGR